MAKNNNVTTTNIAYQPSMAKSLAQYLAFPAIMSLGLYLAFAANRRGMDPSLTLGAISTVAMLFIALLERWIPFRKDWNRSRGDIFTDILHNLFSSYAAIEFAKIGLLMLLLPMVTWASSEFGSGLWQENLPLLLRLAIAAIIIEFGCYWMHRIYHETDYFWRFHATHHSPELLYWLNAGRDHPLGAIFTTIASLPPVIILGVDAETMMLYFIMQSIHGLFQHANINVRLGWLNWVFSMAELHRWHHSTVVAEANNNYGLTLIFWDIVFRTRFLPHLGGPVEIGIAAMPGFPKTYWKQLTIPFRWRYWVRVSKDKTVNTDS